MNTETMQETEQEPLQLLTFLLDKEIFAMDIRQVQEVLEYSRITAVPRTADFMLGVINLRGSIVAVIDMRRQFDMTVTEVTVDSCIIITEVEIDEEACTLGLLADAVREVIELDLTQLSPAPRIGSSIDTRFIMGMGKYKDDFVTILDLSKVFSSEELDNLMGNTNVTPDKKQLSGKANDSE